jgi:quercetin dioxygenase-like cupin family protein
MKKITFCAALVIFMLFSFNQMIYAQDFYKVNPDGKKILVDTTTIRVMEVEFMPGKKDPMHTHPAHFFYALTDGKIKVVYADGKEVIYDMKAGESGYSGPEGAHATEAMGDKPMKFLIVELKDHPYIPKAKK